MMRPMDQKQTIDHFLAVYVNLIPLNTNKLGLRWAKLKFSLVRVVDEVTVIFNLVEVEIVVEV